MSKIIKVTSGGASTAFYPGITTETHRPRIEILSGNNQRTDSAGEIKYPLVVIVKEGENRKPGVQVTFHTTKGELSGYTEGSTSTDTPSSTPMPRNDEKRVWVRTDANGRAQVTYYQDPGSGSDTVIATISGDNYEREVTFGINGSGSSGPSEPSNAITITLSSTTGEPGEEVTINVSSSPSRALVTLGSNDFGATRFSPQSGRDAFHEYALTSGRGRDA